MRQKHDVAGNGTRMAKLIASQREGFALDQVFYKDDQIYQQDLERIFLKEWIYVGHVSELPEPGCFFTTEIADESIIVTRDNEGVFHALLNVCRHRGSRVCLKASGRAGRFVCPYHAWTYGLDGSLLAARLTEGTVELENYGLKTIAIEELEGLLFVNFAAEPTSFALARQELTPLLEPYGLADTRIAHRANYPIAANWKLTFENYAECYHCTPAHPEFSKSHSIHLPDAQCKTFQPAMQERAAAAGIPAEKLSRKGDACPPGETDFYYGRYALFDGYVTGSEDGKRLAPLLGRVKDYDGGASDLGIGLLNHMLIYADHVVIYRFLPVSPDQSLCEVIWLVRSDAVEGVDYDLERLIWLWDVTTIADKEIIEKNQLGVNSRYYEPGPYTPMEDHTQRFVSRYLELLQAA